MIAAFPNSKPADRFRRFKDSQQKHPGTLWRAASDYGLSSGGIGSFSSILRISFGACFPEGTLHVRRKFTQKIGYRIRAQAASKAIQLFCSELANKAPRNSDVLAKSRTYFVSTKESMSEAAKITR